MNKTVEPSTAEIKFSQSNIIYNNVGIDTIQLIANYKTVIKLVERMGLSVVTPFKNSPVNQTIQDIEKRKDKNHRYKTDNFKPCTQIVKLSKGTSLSNCMIITQNIPLLFDHAEHHKKAKDTFCLITFAGLHQPTKKISSEAMKLMSKFLKRKTFKVLPFDIAIDTEDTTPINYKRKTSFKEQLAPFSNGGIIIPPNGATSLYINNVEPYPLTRILYYDKYLKMTRHHKQKGFSNDLKNWKRLEITVKPLAITHKRNKGFIDYVKSLEFDNTLFVVDEVIKKARIKNASFDYFIYQLNSLIDNRVMNNLASKKQFNSVESLERFKQSDFIIYTIMT